MGTWGVGIYSNDEAADIGADLRDLIADGLSADDATTKLADDYGIGEQGVDDNDFWLGLAAAQHQIGHISDNVIERAITIIEDPRELGRWGPADRARRRAALNRLGKRLRRQAPAPSASVGGQRSTRTWRPASTSSSTPEHGRSSYASNG